MKLSDLILAVKEQNLSKEQLEGYSDQLSSLFAQMVLEKSDLEKAEAMFMAEDKYANDSVAQRKVLWKSLPSGQRLIELKNYLIATKEMILSLKSRTFRLIY